MSPGGGTVRSRLIVAALAGSVVLSGLAACSSSPIAGPTSSSDPPPTTSATPKSEIANPLDTSKYATDTCSGLTNAQVTPYIGAVEKTDPGPNMPGSVCTFLPSDITKPVVGSGLSNIATPTQESLYESLAQFPWRQKINAIAGYPAVDSSTEESPQKGYCNTNVAVNDTHSVLVVFQDPQASDPYYAKPCTAAEALAANLIQNLQSGGA